VSTFILAYYASVNLLLLSAMGLDKRKAIRVKYRIPEKTLFAFALFGGGIGGLSGMLLFRHKTRKAAFWLVFIVTTLAHAALAYRLLNQ